MDVRFITIFSSMGVALEEKNVALEESHQFIERARVHGSDILIVCDLAAASKKVVNRHALCGQDSAELAHTPVFDLFADDVERASA